VQKISSVVSRILTACIAYPFYWLGLDLDTEEALGSMTGERQIFYLPQDFIIHGFSGLQYADPDRAIAVEGDHFSSLSEQRVSDQSAGAIAAHFLADLAHAQ